jgi:23S rRNA (guanosine2251-2'-O)-methyltransferase
VNIIYGINAISEALTSRGRSFEYIAVARDRHDSRIHRLIAECRRMGISVRFVSRTELDRMSRTAAHQGIVAVASGKKYSELDEILSRRRGNYAFVVVLDGVEDPHNLGAVIRTAEGAGADGVIIPDRRAVGVTGIVAKASAGAVEHVPIAKVTNIGRTLEELKSRNIWTIGLDQRAEKTYDQLDYQMDCALVLGAEGTGLHEQVRKKCDFLVSIPMSGKVASLNVSVAAAVVLYEIARQRRQLSTAPATPVSQTSS